MISQTTNTVFPQAAFAGGGATPPSRWQAHPGLKDLINPNAVDSARHSHVQLGATSSPREAFSELKNLCVWNKTNGGMGSFYRSKHEQVFVFKVGDGAHTNSFGLGDTGRYHTNVWDYAGISSLTQSRTDVRARHPTIAG